MPTPRYNLPTITPAMTADVPRDLNALANATDEALHTAVSSLSSRAVDITIADTANYYTTKNVEAALQAVGQTLNGTRASLVSTAQALGVM